MGNGWMDGNPDVKELLVAFIIFKKCDEKL
jgi:hypothetical protein